jgi:chaperonin cofactor prefoldin
MSLKTTASRIGNALIDVANEMHNQSIRNQIEEIDGQQGALRSQLTRLEEQRSELKSQLS